MRPDKPEYGAMLAMVASLRSEDPDTQVGCALFSHDWRVLGTGYNGLPKGITLPDGTPRDVKRGYMIHAEQNACSACSGSPLIAVITHSPCQSCLSLLVSRGVREIYFIQKYWRETSSEQAKLFGIKMEQLLLRKELFDEFTKLTTGLVSTQLTHGG